MSVIEQIIYSSGGATILVGIIAWLSKNLLLTRLKASVSHEFEKKLENLRADLRSNEAEIAAIRQSAAESLAGRGKVVDERKLQAIDSIWTGFRKAKSRSGAMKTFAILNVDALGAEVTDPKINQYIHAAFPGVTANSERNI